MKRYFIEDVKCGVSEGGMACGPVGGNVVATIRIKDTESEKSLWLSAVEVEGMPNCYIHDYDPYDKLIEENFDDSEFWDDMESRYIEDFDGICVNDYDELLNDVIEQPENPAGQLLRFMVTLLRCGMDEIDDLVQLATGKFVDEIDVPASDIEEEYLEDLTDEEY